MPVFFSLVLDALIFDCLAGGFVCQKVPVVSAFLAFRAALVVDLQKTKVVFEQSVLVGRSVDFASLSSSNWEDSLVLCLQLLLRWGDASRALVRHICLSRGLDGLWTGTPTTPGTVV